jgi:predicted esterase
MNLIYRERPAAGEPTGLLVLHHGRGADEHDLLGPADVLDPDRRLAVVTPRAPLAIGGGYHAHGRRDPVMDVDFARGARALLEASGLHVEYHESDAAHQIDPAHFPAAIRWLACATAERRSGTATTTTEGC